MKLEEFISDPKSRELIETVREFAKSFFDREGTHGFSHVERVFNLCMHIGKEEGADLEVLALAALLHDIARPLEDSGKVEDHALEGARIARRYLRSLGYPEDKVEAVAHAIEAHRFSRGPEPATLEAKILSDADKLDAIGAVGIARVFMYSGEHGRGIDASIKHFEEKILKLKDLMYTETARKMAEERHRFTEEFIERLRREIEGEI
ncbi:metal-dependent phosphohydrolase, HD superfamily [Thermococcus kodakarensis KOD1]|uniref:Metal-dependent phosphohydrolase, HD superfamily n=1 Tax=Thermococcus kodakarensis (strain ATCC BAA-918 / JCM 12380 / KOD1) TaxID=69014 RepID=Q5JD58_THEKO|nr:HD domain-containing protein [Thermococcus kodakarensis]WCN28539.1 HD domain-containing protein [Thermococcus kodakarensis]WCN30836.1 HD domain-containing protein [Thermococcus kodakarensis]BAD84669.1 metal-dependent phosphohydrolase, HD superfamily [Thermococcus kodakarensis KOD1]